MLDILQRCSLFDISRGAEDVAAPLKPRQQAYQRVLDRFEVDTTHLAPVAYNEFLAIVHGLLMESRPCDLDEIASTRAVSSSTATFDGISKEKAAAREEIFDNLQEYEWALYFPSLQNLIARLQSGKDALTPTHKRSKKKRKQLKKAMSAIVGSRGTASHSSRLFGLRGPAPVKQPVAIEEVSDFVRWVIAQSCHQLLFFRPCSRC